MNRPGRIWLPRPGEAVAFVVGACIGIGFAVYSDGWPTFVTMTVSFLCPGFYLATPLAFLMALLSPGMDWFLPYLAVSNGFCYALAWYLSRIAWGGEKVARLVLVVAVGFWIAGFVQWRIENRPRPEPPIMPVDLASPLAGRWDGVMDGEGSDPPVSMVCHPRTDGTLDGFLYVSGLEMGPFEAGMWAGDSLYFEIGGFEYAGHRDSSRISMVSTANTLSPQGVELWFVSADTTRLALSSIDDTFSAPPTKGPQ